MRRIKVWDLPVRLFHWAMVLLIFFAWGTQEWDHMDWHVWIGYTILTLVLFRIVWGLIGSDTARFARFLRSPLAALAHLRHITRREADHEIGHNAAGGWMVLVMLLLIAVQACTGLFANDDGNTEGPLMHFVSKNRSDWLSHIHSLNFTLIEIVIALHIVAVLAYAVLKRQNLVRPMITGTKQLPGDAAAPRLVSPVWALLTLAIAAGAVAFVVRL
jgi:cytochrome b